MADENLKQVHLWLGMAGKGQPLNGRGVRFRVLDATEIAALEDEAAVLIGGDGTVAAFRNAAMRCWLSAMVVAVTAPGLTDLGGAAWVSVSRQELTNWSKYFGARETAFLERVYRMHHELDKEEFDILVGKVLPVVSGESPQPGGSAEPKTGDRMPTSPATPISPGLRSSA